MAITAYILWNVVKRLRETLFLFLQGQPNDINRDEIEWVESIHHTHIWSLDGEHHVFTAHVKLDKMDSLDQMLAVKNSLKQIMKKYPFEDYTIETEIDQENFEV